MDNQPQPEQTPQAELGPPPVQRKKRKYKKRQKRPAITEAPENEPKVLKLTPRAVRRFNSIGEVNEPAAEILWVYHHMRDESPDPMTCPSRGAWNMLELAIPNQKWFMERMYRPICGEIAKKRADTTGFEMTKREKHCRAVIDQMLDEAEAALKP